MKKLLILSAIVLQGCQSAKSQEHKDFPRHNPGNATVTHASLNEVVNNLQALQKELKVIRQELQGLKQEQTQDKQAVIDFDQCEKSCNIEYEKWDEYYSKIYGKRFMENPKEWPKEIIQKLYELNHECWKKCEKIRPPGVMGQC